MKVINFIKDNPLRENQYYNNIDGIVPIFGICENNTNKIIKYIIVDNKNIYYAEKDFLYVENKKTGKIRKIKLDNQNKV